MEAPPPTYRTQRIHYEMPWNLHRKHSEGFSSSLHGSELFWLHEENLHSIRQVVIMFCLIAVTGHKS